MGKLSTRNLAAPARMMSESPPAGTGGGWRRTASAVALLRLFAGCVALFVVVAGVTGFPVPVGDAPCFMPASIQLVNGHGLTDPVYQPARDYDPLGGARLIYHGFGFELVLAALIWALAGAFPGLFPGASFASVAAVAIVNAASLIAISEACVPLVRRSLRPVRSALVAVLGVTTFMALLFAYAGRPEPLAAVPVSCAVLAIVFRGPSRTTAMLCGLCIGVAVTISPLPAVLAGLLLVLWYASVEDARLFWVDGVLSAAMASVAFFALIATAYPYPIADWLHGVRAHAASVEGGMDFGTFVPYLVTSAEAPLFGLTLLLMLGMGCGFLVERWRAGRSGLLLFGGFAVFLLFLVQSSILAVSRYNFIPLWPALLAFCIWRTSSPVASDGAHMRGKAWLPAALMLAFALPSLGSLRMALLYPLFLTHGVSQARAQQDFTQHLALVQGNPIAVSRSIFLVTEDYSRIIAYMDDPPRSPVRVVQQYWQANGLTPPDMPGYRKVFDNFYGKHPALFGVPIARTLPGYQFAVYVRSETPGTP